MMMTIWICGIVWRSLQHYLFFFFPSILEIIILSYIIYLYVCMGEKSARYGSVVVLELFFKKA